MTAGKALLLITAAAGMLGMAGPARAELRELPAPAGAQALGGLGLPDEQAAAWSAAAPKWDVPEVTVLGLRRINDHRRSLGRPELPVRGAGAAARSAASPTAAPTEAQAVSLAQGAGYLAAAVAQDLPAAVDNSLLDAFPPIGNQGSLGSCVSWASTYYMMTHNTALARGWDAKHGGDPVHFSPLWTFNQINYANGDPSQGSNFEDALPLMRYHGAARMSEFFSGVSPIDRAWPSDPAVWRRAITCRMRNYYTQAIVNAPPAAASADLANLKALLNNGLVVNFYAYINSWHYTTVADDPETAADDPWVGQGICYYVDNTANGPHGMTIVGYHDALWIDLNGDGRVQAAEKGALKIANSWGAGWGNQGFTWLAYDALLSVSAAGGPAARDHAIRYDTLYWAVAYDHYQPTRVAEFTLQAAYRNDVAVTLQRAALGALPPFAAPEQSWTAWTFYRAKAGPNGFDGNSYASNPSAAPAFTFVFDLTDVYEPSDLPRRYVLKTADRNTADTAGTRPVAVTAFRVLYGTGTRVLGTSGEVPQTAEGATVYPWVDPDSAPPPPQAPRRLRRTPR